MRIELYSTPEDEEAKKIKDFLVKHHLPFQEILTNDISVFNKVHQMPLNTKTASLKVVYSSAIGVITGFNEFALNQLIEHIKKYNPKIKCLKKI